MSAHSSALSMQMISGQSRPTRKIRCQMTAGEFCAFVVCAAKSEDQDAMWAVCRLCPDSSFSSGNPSVTEKSCHPLFHIAEFSPSRLPWLLCLERTMWRSPAFAQLFRRCTKLNAEPLDRRSRDRLCLTKSRNCGSTTQNNIHFEMEAAYITGSQQAIMSALSMICFRVFLIIHGS